MKLVQLNKYKWAALDEDGTILIISSNSNIVRVNAPIIKKARNKKKYNRRAKSK